jgi:hypothetical protein
MTGGPEIEALKALAANSQSWTDWATFAVFIGLLGEIGITFAYTKDKPRSEIILGIVCGVVIAVGVLGELRFGSRAAQANAQLRIISEGRLADAEDRLGKAEDRTRQALADAGDASKRAEKASEQAGKATTKAAILEKEAAVLRSQAAELTKANLATESRLTEANQKRVELAASLLPRDFFDQSGAIAKLIPFPPMTVVFEFTNEHEPTAMAEQINFVLKTLHWRAFRKSVDEGLIGDGISISVGLEPPSSFPPGTPKEERFKSVKPEYRQKRLIGEMAAEALREGIKQCGIDAEIGNDAYGLPPNTLLVEVGPKPNHALETALKELGPRPNPTPLVRGSNGPLLGGNREAIREQFADPAKNRPQ